MILDENTELFAINVAHHSGIPALEHELPTNTYYVLVFTSEQAAQKYCYLRQPDKKDDIYQLEKKYIGKDMVQTGLQKIARRALLGYKHIAGVMWDHPGAAGLSVSVTDIKDIVRMSVVHREEQKKFFEELNDHFNKE